MIGVVASESNRPVVREFFELFKTPWEFARPGRRYPVGVVTDGEPAAVDAALCLLYGSHRCDWDETHGEVPEPHPGPIRLDAGRHPIAVYGACATFGEAEPAGLTVAGTDRPAAMEVSTEAGRVVRIGYHLFEEIRHLLTEGQPPDQAALPSLDHHIAFLRSLILDHGIDLVEIPPIPHGHPFTVCLSHDVDHPRLRHHLCDHTLLGFVYRATVGSVRQWLRGRLAFGAVVQNFLAVIGLPLVHLGLIRDPWNTFARYLEIERGLASTFFIIPFKGRPGLDAGGVVRKKRGAAYGARDLAEDLRNVAAAGHEVGLHGIDAWRDPALGREEHAQVAPHQSGSESGVRMHWLYFGADSHRLLEKAGFTYDSTVGYNGTVGCRAGTFQAYKPLTAGKLLELPLHIMDTALFYPDHLGLSDADAREKVMAIGRQARELGGVVTVNWHDRSLAPERLWGGLYTTLIDEWRAQEAWFPTMEQAARWFRLRRSARFSVADDGGQMNGTVQIEVDPAVDADLPFLVCRVHRATNRDRGAAASRHDHPIAGRHEVAWEHAVAA